MKKKALSVLLCLAMLVGLFPVSVFADDYDFTVTVESKELAYDEPTKTVTLAIKADKQFPAGVTSIQFAIEYDSESFTLNSIVAAENFVPYIISGDSASDQSGVPVSPTTSSVEGTYAAGTNKSMWFRDENNLTIAKIALTAKDGIENGNYTVKLVPTIATDPNSLRFAGSNGKFDVGYVDGTITVTGGAAPVIGGVTLANSTVYVDTTKVYSDYASGSSTTEIPGGTIQATATRQKAGATFASQSDVTWSVTAPNGAATDKVTINDTGVITVAANATPGSYTIKAEEKASSSSGSATATLTVAKTNVAPTSIVVSDGVTTMHVGEAEVVADTAFTAVVKDQWEEEMDGEEVDWSVTPADQGVTIDAEGKLHVAANATVDGTTGKDFTVTATSKTKNTVTANAASTVKVSSLAPWTFTGVYANGSGSVTYGDAAPTLTATVSDSDATPTFKDYTSRNTNVATIDSTGAVTIVGAGETSLSVTAAYLADHHAATTGSYTLTVNKADITPTVSIEGWTYGGTAGTPSVDATTNPGNGAVTYQYKVKDANDSTYSDTVPTNAGNYTVKATVAETANYNSGTATANFAIAKATISSDDLNLSITGWTYGEAAKTPSVATNYNATYTYKAKDATDDTYSSDAPTDAGNYVVKASVAATDNYNAAEATKEFTIARKTVTPTVTLSKNSDEYSGTNQKESITVTVKDGETELATTEYTVTWSKGGTTVDKIIDYGEYTVTVGDVEGGNYVITPVTATYTVTKKQVIVSGITAQNKTYDGGTDAVLDLSQIVFKAKDNSTVLNDATLAVTATGTFENKNVGTGKTVTIDDLALTPAAAASYTLATENQQTETTANITAREITVSGITAQDKTYDGETTATLVYTTVTLADKVATDNLTVTATGTFENANAGADKTVNISNIKLNGTDKDNYVLKSGEDVQQASTTATISPKPITPTITLSATSSNYTGVNQKPTVTVRESAAEDATTLTETTDYTLEWTKGTDTAEEIKDVGTYTVTVTGKTSGSNYSFTTATAKFTMNKAAQAAVTVSEISGVTYGSDKTGVTVSGGSGTGGYSLVLDVTTGATENDVVKLVTNATTGAVTITPKKATATNVTVYGKRAGGDNYADAYSEGVNFTIAKATVSASIDTVTAKTYDGTTGGEGTLKLTGVKSGDTVTAAGTFTWAEAAAGTKNIGVKNITLSGTDADNYQLSATTISAEAAPNNLEIAKKTVTLTWSTDTTLTYNGSAQTYAGATVDGAVSGEELGVTYSGTNKATQTNAGDYTAEVTGLSGSTASNYEIASTATTTRTWRISPLPVQVKWMIGATSDPYQSSMPFTDAEYAKPTPKAFDANGTTELNSNLISFTLPTANLVTVAADSTTATAPEVKNVANYRATAALGEGFTASNYTITGAELNFSVQKANVSITWKVDGAAIDAAGYPFSLDGHTITFDVTCEGVDSSNTTVINALKANFVIGEFKVGNQNAATLDGSTDTSKKVNAVGTYTATIGAAAGKSLDNFNITGNNATFKINPKQVGVKWVVKQGSADATPNASGEYSFIEDASGYTVTAVAVESDGTTPVNGVTLTVKKGTDAATTNATIKDVANYAFEVGELATTASGDAASNYQLPSDKGATTIKIVPATVTVAWKLGGADKTDSTYTGEAQAVTAEIKNGATDVTGKFNITPATGADYTASLTNAGEYTFSVVAEQDADKANYTLPTNATQTFTIAKATRTLTASIPGAIKGVSGTGTVTLALGENGNKDDSAKDCDLTVTANPTGIVTLPSAGKYVTSYVVTGAGVGATDLTFTLAASDNYNAATAKATVTVDSGYTITIGSVTGGSVKADKYAAAAGSEVKMTLTPANGYKIPTASGISGVSAVAVEGSTNEFKFTMPNDDVTVGVTFVKDEFNITTQTVTGVNYTIKNSADTTITKAGLSDTVKVVLSGDNVTNGLVSRVYFVKAEPESGETPKEYDLTADSANTYTFKMPAYAVKVAAVVAEKRTITVASATNGSITSPSSGDVLPGTTVTVALSPATGYSSGGVTYVMDGVSGAKAERALSTGTPNQYSFTMPDAPITLSATFVADEAKSAAESTVQAGGTQVGETATNTTAVEASVDTEMLEQIKTAVADVSTSVSAANALKGTTDVSINVAEDKDEAINKLASAGIISVTQADDGNGGKTTTVKDNDTDSEAQVRIVTKTFLDVSVTDYSDTGAGAQMTLDITPKAEKVATILPANSNKELDETNSVSLGAAETTTVTAPVELSLGIPRAMGLKAGGLGGFIFLTHIKSGDAKYLYRLELLTGTDGNFKVTFTNDKGFSTFTLSVEDPSVASYAYSNSETRYFDSFAKAVEDAITNSKTAITLHKNPASSDKAQITEPVTLTISKASNDVTITNGELYNTNFNITNNTLDKGSTAAEINVGTLKFAKKHTVTISGATSVQVGSTITLTATVKDVKGDIENAATVTWTSNDVSKATVSDGGVVTGVAAGSATITATYTDTGDSNKTYTATQSVTVSTAGGNNGNSGSTGGTTSTAGSTTAKVSTSVSGTTATVTVKDADLATAANGGSNSDPIVIDLSKDSGTINSVILPAGIAGKIANLDKADGLEIKLTTGEIMLNDAALETIDKAGSGTISLLLAEKSESSLSTAQKTALAGKILNDVYELTLTVAGKAIKSFNGGTATVSIPFTPAAGTKGSNYAVLYIPSAGAIERMTTSYKNDVLTFTTGHFSTYVVVYEGAKSNSFTDVPAGSWFTNAVAWAVSKNVTDGIGNNKFAPYGECTRAQMVTFLWRAAGMPEPTGNVTTFDDVVAGSWYDKAVQWAVANGITEGVGDGFHPDDKVSRAQAVTFLYRAMKGVGTNTSSFSDVPTDVWYTEAVQWAVANGITDGTGKGFEPNTHVNRAMAVTFLYRCYNK